MIRPSIMIPRQVSRASRAAFAPVLAVAIWWEVFIETWVAVYFPGSK